MMFKLNGAVLTLTSMVSTTIQRLQALMQRGVSNTSVQTVTGKHKLVDAQERLQAAQSKLKRKPKVVLQTTQEVSLKQTQNPVLAILGQGGLQRQIRASNSPLPVKSAVKRKPKAVKSTKVEALQIPGLALVLTPTEALSGERGKRKTTVSKTPQRAKTAQTQKRKAADSTTQGKKSTKSKTSAKTPTVRQRKVRGA
jgi:hypothetical protein